MKNTLEIYEKISNINIINDWEIQKLFLWNKGVLQIKQKLIIIE